MGTSRCRPFFLKVAAKYTRGFEVKLADGKCGGHGAGWISLGEMIKLQELSTLISDVLRVAGQRNRGIVWDQIWNEMNEEWAKYMWCEGNSPAL